MKVVSKKKKVKVVFDKYTLIEIVKIYLVIKFLLIFL